MDRLTHSEVSLSVALHGLGIDAAGAVDQLRGVRGGSVDVQIRVEVFVYLALLDEEWEWVAPSVCTSNLEHLHLVIRKVVVEHKGTELAIERFAIVPRHVEAEDLAVILEELIELVALEDGGGGAKAGLHAADEIIVHWARVEILLVAHNVRLHLLASRRVRIRRRLQGSRYFDAELLHEGAGEVVGVGEQEDTAVEVKLDPDVEVRGIVEVTIGLRHAMALEEDRSLALTLRDAGVLYLGLGDVHRVVLQIIVEGALADAVILQTGFMHSLLEVAVETQDLSVEGEPSWGHGLR
mmetsp:Transcript_8111/g.25327  ORF Transcript_8111/g.25327 Transcript_8111/m.25327 type:complete len:295 (+) Transcript_8111:1222-2106(+)